MHSIYMYIACLYNLRLNIKICYRICTKKSVINVNVYNVFNIPIFSVSVLTISVFKRQYIFGIMSLFITISYKFSF